MATATTMGDSILVRIEQQTMIEALHKDPVFSELLLT